MRPLDYGHLAISWQILSSAYWDRDVNRKRLQPSFAAPNYFAPMRLTRPRLFDVFLTFELKRFISIFVNRSKLMIASNFYRSDSVRV